MAAASQTLSFDTAFEPRTGTPVPVAPGVVRITASNAGPFTFTGTNTFVIGAERLAIVDPGPSDAGHLRAILDHVGGRPVEAILLTHTHRDHSDLVRELQAAVRAPLWFGGGTGRAARGGGSRSTGCGARAITGSCPTACCPTANGSSSGRESR